MDSPKEHESVVHDTDDLTKARHTIGDHLVTLHRRLVSLEENHTEWTTHGWEPPPGADRKLGEES